MICVFLNKMLITVNIYQSNEFLRLKKYFINIYVFRYLNVAFKTGILPIF